MDAWDAVAPGAARAADREAVRTAEQVVSDAWIGRLLLAESEAEAVLGACARVRERATDRVRAAQRTGDLAALIRSQTALELADAGWGQAPEAHERDRARLARELPLWSQGITGRVRQTRADWRSAGQR